MLDYTKHSSRLLYLGEKEVSVLTGIDMMVASLRRALYEDRNKS